MLMWKPDTATGVARRFHPGCMFSRKKHHLLAERVRGDLKARLVCVTRSVFAREREYRIKFYKRGRYGIWKETGYLDVASISLASALVNDMHSAFSGTKV